MALADTIMALARDTWSRFTDGGRTPATLNDAVESVIKLSDDLSHEIQMRNIPDLDKIACAPGCAWCCHYQVGVSAPQALYIAAKIAKGAGTRSREIHEQRLQALDARTRGLTAAQRLKLNVGCAFLDDQNACTIYDFRPFGCRGANSVNADTCRSFVEETATATQLESDWLHKVPYEIQRDVQEGFQQGAVENGLRGDRLELTAAVIVALETPDAAKRWMAGEDIFRAARLPGED